MGDIIQLTDSLAGMTQQYVSSHILPYFGLEIS